MALPAEAAGITKGAFYKSCVSRELLFFDILEGLHAEGSEAAAAALANKRRILRRCGGRYC
ncbi:hypothetical protein HCH52_01735 [Oscillospiraceae bacterium HV4-5-C5C]|nr:hypothetical protein [Oscillospiraceae bacterium HV4-5-C5C]